MHLHQTRDCVAENVPVTFERYIGHVTGARGDTREGAQVCSTRPVTLVG